MSTYVNVSVYSTSNLLILAGSAPQLRLLPKHRWSKQAPRWVQGAKMLQFGNEL